MKQEATGHRPVLVHSIEVHCHGSENQNYYDMTRLLKSMKNE